MRVSDVIKNNSVRSVIKLLPEITGMILCMALGACGLMVAWCMTDGTMVGSEQTDSYCENIVKPALKTYKQ